MQNRNIIRYIRPALIASFGSLLLSACGGSGGSSNVSDFFNNNNNAVGANPVDRMGRAGINTAITDPFFCDGDATNNSTSAGMCTQNAAALQQHGELTDQFNSVTSQNAAISQFADRFEANLAIYDGLDRNCGNQLLADATPDRYAALAGVLANDQIFINSNNDTCDQYFGVELGAAGDCGGRTITYDVIDVTYSALAIGATSGVGDGIASDLDDPRSEALKETSFPFLAPPF